MRYQQIIPATDWYYRFQDPVTKSVHFMLLVAIALNQDGQAVGLVAVTPPGGSTHLPPDLLVEPPYTTSGRYLHRSQIPADELMMLSTS